MYFPVEVGGVGLRQGSCGFVSPVGCRASEVINHAKSNLANTVQTLIDQGSSALSFCYV